MWGSATLTPVLLKGQTHWIEKSFRKFWRSMIHEISPLRILTEYRSACACEETTSLWRKNPHEGLEETVLSASTEPASSYQTPSRILRRAQN